MAEEPVTEEPTGELQYAYAVVRGVDTALPGALHGVADAPVGTVEHAGLAAVVSPVPAADFDEAPLRERLEDLAWLEKTARAHQSVVDAVASAAPCALPLRLATVYRGTEGVRRMLAADRPGIEAALDRLHGRLEWGVKVYTQPAARSEPAGRRRSGGSGAGAVSGRDYLRQRRAQRQSHEEAQQRSEGRAREVHEALDELAEHTRLHAPQDPQLSGVPGQNVLNAAYLVPRDRAEAFTARVGELSEGTTGLRVELTGPWAPYSFAAFATDASDAGADAGAGSL